MCPLKNKASFSLDVTNSKHHVILGRDIPVFAVAISIKILPESCISTEILQGQAVLDLFLEDTHALG